MRIYYKIDVFVCFSVKNLVVYQDQGHDQGHDHDQGHGQGHDHDHDLDHDLDHDKQQRFS